MRERMLPANNGRAAGGTETQEVQKFPLRHSVVNMCLSASISHRIWLVSEPDRFLSGKNHPANCRSPELHCCSPGSTSTRRPRPRPHRRKAASAAGKNRMASRSRLCCALVVCSLEGCPEVGMSRFSLGRRCGCVSGVLALASCQPATRVQATRRHHEWMEDKPWSRSQEYVSVGLLK